MPGDPETSSSPDLPALEAMLRGARQELDQLRNDVQERIERVENDLREVTDSLDLLTERGSSPTETVAPAAEVSSASSPAVAPELVAQVVEPALIESLDTPEPSRSAPEPVVPTNTAAVTTAAVPLRAPDPEPSPADLSVDEVLHREFAEYQPDAFHMAAPPASRRSAESPNGRADPSEDADDPGDDFFARRSR